MLPNFSGHFSRVVVSDFNALHSGKHNEEVQLCAFDVAVI